MNIETVLVIGAGGTGSMLMQPLSRFLYSLGWSGSLIIADGDAYEESNSDRQAFAASYVGLNKAEYQAMAIGSSLPEVPYDVTFIDEYLSQEAIDELIIEKTMVINCVDNLAARKYVEDRIDELNNGVHICCGNNLRDGQVQVSMKYQGERITPSLYENSPNFNSENGDRSEMSCQDIADLESGGQLIAANMMSASLALCFVIQIMGDYPLHQGGTFIPESFIRFDVFTHGFEGKQPAKLVFS